MSDSIQVARRHRENMWQIVLCRF